MDANTDVGGRFIREWLETQIIPVDAVILLAGVWSVGSARKWVELELEYAAKHNKIVVGLPTIDAPVESFTGELRGRVAAVAPWDAGKIVAILSSLQSAKGANP